MKGIPMKSRIVRPLAIAILWISTQARSFDIVDTKEYGYVKCVYKVQLEKEYTLDELKGAGEKVKGRCENSKTVFIFYFLPDQSLNSNAWAYTHYTPKLDAKIVGMTQSQKKTMKDPEGVILGKWIDNGAYGARYVLTKQNGTLKMVCTYPDGSSSTDILIEKAAAPNKKYAIKGNRFGEYYVIKSKTLGVYDETGVEAITADKEN